MPNTMKVPAFLAAVVAAGGLLASTACLFAGQSVPLAAGVAPVALVAGATTPVTSATPAIFAAKKAYLPVEITFQLPGLTGNPFDYTENDVRVVVTAPDGTARTLPAFYDGGATWRVRLTPERGGAHRITSVQRNGSPIDAKDLTPRQFTPTEAKTPGMVRRAPKDSTRLVFENGSVYYPLGHNAAWRNGNVDVPEIFAKMKAAGENWSRVWMCHWDGKNLDWVNGEKGASGQYHLEVARRWDAIVKAAEANGIYFQMVLQHHGQYSSTVNSNWGENPWNRANGGFLDKPEDFFTDERARKLTRIKYRYIVARWGYSPAILAWELFNEVQFTDAIRNKHPETVAAWHKEMAAFLREQDPYHHLFITSSDTDLPGLYDVMDYLQPHAYNPDPIATALGIRPADWKKPIFYGEVGPSGNLNTDDGSYLRAILWASLVSESSGAAQYWTWDQVDRANLYPAFHSATAFLKETGLPKHTGLKPIEAEVRTPGQAGSLAFGPGGGWGAGKGSAFPIRPNGSVPGVEAMPSYLQGKSHQDLFTHAEFTVDLPAPAAFGVRLNQIAKAGAEVVIAVDGAEVARKAFPAADQDTGTNTVVSADIPAGKHTILLKNDGADWVRLTRFTLAPFGPTLRVIGKAGNGVAALYVRNNRPDGPSQGTVTLPGLPAGKYHILLWDIAGGKEQSHAEATVTATGALTLQTPPVEKELAVFLERR